MKQYGFKKSTEFTKKQVNIIWAKAKNGELTVEKWFMNDLYNLADYYGYDDNRSVESDEIKVMDILNAVFANNNEQAQKLINRTANDWFNSYSRKNQALRDRTVFVR